MARKTRRDLQDEQGGRRTFYDSRRAQETPYAYRRLSGHVDIDPFSKASQIGRKVHQFPHEVLRPVFSLVTQARQNFTKINGQRSVVAVSTNELAGVPQFEGMDTSTLRSTQVAKLALQHASKRTGVHSGINVPYELVLEDGLLSARPTDYPEGNNPVEVLRAERQFLLNRLGIMAARNVRDVHDVPLYTVDQPNSQFVELIENWNAKPDLLRVLNLGELCVMPQYDLT